MKTQATLTPARLRQGATVGTVVTAATAAAQLGGAASQHLQVRERRWIAERSLRSRASRIRRVMSWVGSAAILLALIPSTASAALRVGSTTDPVGDLPQRVDGSRVDFGDLKEMDVVYDDGTGEIDARIALDRTPASAEYFALEFFLGQAWSGGQCVTNSQQYDVEFRSNWYFDWYGPGSPFVSSYVSIAAVGVLPAFGTGSAAGSRLRAVAGGPVYQTRNYVCVGDIKLRGSHWGPDGGKYPSGGVDEVADFALGGASPPPTPPPPIAGVIDTASPLVLDKGDYKPGEVMTGKAVWRNPSVSSVTARHLVLSIRPAGAPEGVGFVGDFAPRIDDRTLSPHETIAHTSQFRIPETVTPGRWVLWASWQDTNGVWHGAATLPFSINSAPGGASTQPSGQGASDPPAPLIVATVRRAGLRRVLRRGLIVETQLSQAARVKITALLGRRQAALLRLPRAIGTGSASVDEDATKKIRVRFSSKARRILSRLSKLKLTLKIQAQGASGKQRIATRAVTLRR